MRTHRLHYSYAVAIIFTLSAVIGLGGCGGGGGGGTTKGAKRSLQYVTSNQLPDISLPSISTHTVQAFWVDVTSGANLGQATIVSVSKSAGTGDVSLSGGVITLINDLASDQFTLSLTVNHDQSDDPDFGKTETGVQIVHIIPDSPRILPVGSLTVTQGGKITLQAQAQNGRASGTYEIVQAPPKSRLYVPVPTTSWAISPTNAGTISNNNDGTVTVTGSPAFAGSATVTATIIGSAAKVTATLNYVAPPVVVISSPTEGQTISGTISVTYSVSNATTTNYQVDSSAVTSTPTSGSVALDTTTLPNGNHSVTVSGTGQFVTSSLTRNFTVNNVIAPPRKEGKLSLDSLMSPTSTAEVGSWGAGLTNSERLIFADGFLKRYSQNGTLQGQVQVLMTTSYVVPAITDDKKVAVPDTDNNQLIIVDPLNLNGTQVRINGVNGGVACSNVPGENKVLVTGLNGIYTVNLGTKTSTKMWNIVTPTIAFDGTNVWYTEPGTSDIVARNRATSSESHRISNPGDVYSLYVSKSYNVLAASVKSVGVVQYKLDGASIAGSLIPAKANSSWLAFGPDLKDTTNDRVFTFSDRSPILTPFLFSP